MLGTNIGKTHKRDRFSSGFSDVNHLQFGLDRTRRLYDRWRWFQRGAAAETQLPGAAAACTNGSPDHRCHRRQLHNSRPHFARSVAAKCVDHISRCAAECGGEYLRSWVDAEREHPHRPRHADAARGEAHLQADCGEVKLPFDDTRGRCAADSSVGDRCLIASRDLCCCCICTEVVRKFKVCVAKGGRPERAKAPLVPPSTAGAVCDLSNSD
jgi:hypothetical protein